MATIDPSNNIQLNDEQREQLAAIAKETGKPWQDLLAEFFAAYKVQVHTETRPEPESVFDALERHGLIGCIDSGCGDLSTNPVHMEGFGTHKK